jgi:hypothetical protein
MCRCEMCSGQISQHEAAIVYTFFGEPAGSQHAAHPRCFKASELNQDYREKFLRDRYAVPEFSGLIPGFDRSYRELLVHFNFDRVVHRVAFPGALTANSPQDEDGDTHAGLAAPALLVDVLIKTGHANQLRAILHRLPPHVWVLLAMHDDPDFQNQAARLFRVPELPAIFDVLRTGDVSHEHLLGIHECVQGNGALMQAVADAISHYCLDERGALASPGFSGFAGLRHAQLCYLCIPNPVYLPPLLHYLQTGEFDRQGERYRHTHRFYHRAAMLHCALYDESALEAWLGVTHEWLNNTPSGSARSFIAETVRMVEQIIGVNA